MIRARKGGVAGWAVSAYVRAKVRSAFRGVWGRRGLPPGDEPLLVYANHTNFWDGFLVHALSVEAGRDAYCLMDEENLRRYRFLSHLGAFSVPKGEGARVRASLRYAQSLLEKPAAVVLVFPEGEIRPYGEPPRLARGVEFLARRSSVRCVPLVFRYAMFEHECPDVLVDVGEAHPPAPLDTYATRLSEGLSRLSAVRSVDGLSLLVRGRRGVAERWDAARAAGGLA